MSYYGYIYKTTLLRDGRIYIGQKKGAFTSKYLGSGLHLNLAIQKYGQEQFICELIDTAETKEELDRLEIEYIAQARKVLSPDEIFNISKGGDRGPGNYLRKTPTRKTIEKIQNSRAWYRPTEETKKKTSDALKGIKHSDEHNRKNSESCMGRTPWNKGIPNSGFKKGGIPWNKGKKGLKGRSEEGNKKHSESLKRRWAIRKAQSNGS